jgi:hypothetical protein
MSIGNVDSQLARMLPLDRIAEICRKYDVSQLLRMGWKTINARRYH